MMRFLRKKRCICPIKATPTTSTTTIVTTTITNTKVTINTSATIIKTSVATPIKLPLPTGDEPEMIHWRIEVMAKSDRPNTYPQKCLDKCKMNCTVDANHKCFGMVLHSELSQNAASFCANAKNLNSLFAAFIKHINSTGKSIHLVKVKILLFSE